MKPLAISGLATASAAGIGIAALTASLKEKRSGLKLCDFEHAKEIETYIGEVEGVNEETISSKLSHYNCRNNRLAQLCLKQDGFMESISKAKEKYGANRIAVIVGTSTSGILETELAYQNRLDNGSLPENFRQNFQNTHAFFSATRFVADYLGLTGPELSISTACSSSAKAFATASRYIENGLCDAAVVGGVDSLCMTTLYGFSSLGIVSKKPCMPSDKNRNGLSIGEAAGFALLEKPDNANGGTAFLGYGESSDAHHMSSPHPEGLGAKSSMQMALDSASIKSSDIDYINLHGTSTIANDQAESEAIASLFDHTICSSTKGWTGHTLGAAGITEAIITTVAINNSFVPGCLNSKEIDPLIRCNLTLDNKEMGIKYAITNSFGFGGNNCTLLFGADS